MKLQDNVNMEGEKGDSKDEEMANGLVEESESGPQSKSASGDSSERSNDLKHGIPRGDTQITEGHTTKSLETTAEESGTAVVPDRQVHGFFTSFNSINRQSEDGEDISFSVDTLLAEQELDAQETYIESILRHHLDNDNEELYI